MSEKNTNETRARDDAELNEEALEEVAGGTVWSPLRPPPTFPEPIIEGDYL